MKFGVIFEGDLVVELGIKFGAIYFFLVFSWSQLVVSLSRNLFQTSYSDFFGPTFMKE